MKVALGVYALVLLLASAFGLVLGREILKERMIDTLTPAEREWNARRSRDGYLAIGAAVIGLVGFALIWLTIR